MFFYSEILMCVFDFFDYFVNQIIAIYELFFFTTFTVSFSSRNKVYAGGEVENVNYVI